MKIPYRTARSVQGYSLVEMLVVFAIMAVLGALSALTIPSLMSAEALSQASSDISQVLDDARSYAIANHTYVFVGFEEVNASALPNSAAQTQATTVSGGRVAVAIVASQDGSNNFNASSAPAYFNSSNLVAISKVKFISSVHIADFSNLSASTGPMATRAPTSSTFSLGKYITSGTTALFSWPLGSSSGNAQYNFYPNQVIVFDQEGLAGVIGSQTYTASGYTAPLPSWIEIGLQLAHGSVVPAAPASLSSGQLVSIQLDGVSGANHVLRP